MSRESESILGSHPNSNLEPEMKRAAVGEITKDGDQKKTKSAFFEGFDFSDFWEPTAEPPIQLSDKMIARAEKDIGYTLPPSFLAFLRLRNGGIPKKNCSACKGTSWADNHCAVDSISGIGCPGALEEDQENWLDEWGYPRIGVVIAGCPSGGHDLVMLDYAGANLRNNLEKINIEKDGQGEKEATVKELGEPRVVHVDQERNYKVTVLAPDFETWIRELRAPEDFEEEKDGSDEEAEDEDK